MPKFTGFIVLAVIFLGVVIDLTNAADYNVVKSFGANNNGRTDATQAFLNAWKAACSSKTDSTIVVPKGSYLLKPIEFRGPCVKRITFQISGTLVAPDDYRVIGNAGSWILFIKVDRLSVLGGTIDAKGAGYWDCHNSGKNCPAGARSMQFNWANNVVVSGLTSINSQVSHIVINSCTNVMLKNVKIVAPDSSPNTDGIHVQGSTGVTITGTSIQTGDDCISIGPGTKTLLMSNIQCGPGHGISIGSLGKDRNEAGVEDITVRDSTFTGSDNGVRIKSWARASNSYVRNVLYSNIVMKNVANPIIIDQNYCPGNQGCPRQGSGVKISQVTYTNIKGTSRTQKAMTFDCSKSNPCSGIRLEDIKLTYMNQAALSSCTNIGGTSGGVVMPTGCL